MIEKLAIAGTIGAGLAIGLLWPTAHRSPMAAGTRASDVVIARSGDHHYYADALVNGHSVHFMVDTGASETALTEADAQAIGIKVDPSKYEVIGDGASGVVRGQFVQLQTIDLDGIRQSGAKAVVVPGATVSLLGQPFLEQIDQIVIRKDEMRLKAGS
jgi:aspartyl protease family protein